MDEELDLSRLGWKSNAVKHDTNSWTGETKQARNDNFYKYRNGFQIRRRRSINGE